VNILITNIEMDLPSGMVCYVFDLAIALKKEGFTVEIFTSKAGQTAAELIKCGINVVTKLNKLKHIPDVIHAQHNMVTVDALRKFKDTPAVFFLHDRYNRYNVPPVCAKILKYIAVDSFCLERLLYDCRIEKKYTGVIYNWVDTDKFLVRDQYALKPSTALVFSNYATPDNHYKIIKEACDRCGIKLDAAGKGMGHSIFNPEKVLLNYDFVFAKAKAAMESLATGAAVILCDFAGMEKIAAPFNFEYLQKYNFGRKILTRPITVDNIVEEIKKFNADENRLNAILIRDNSSFKKILPQIIELYKEIIKNYAEGKRGPDRNFTMLRIKSFALNNRYFLTNSFLYKKLKIAKLVIYLRRK